MVGGEFTHILNALSAAAELDTVDVSRMGTFFDATNPPQRSGAQFTTTHWSVVLAAGRGETANAGAALETLCRTYWYPLYAYVRRQGHDVEEARDLTQAFFARLLQKDYVARADPERGRFRTYLLTALKHFLVDEWKHSRRQLRGGGVEIFSLDDATAENRYQLEARDKFDAEKIYERRWAMALLEHVLARLKIEFLSNGKEELFAQLKRFLLDEPESHTYGSIAAEMGMTEGAVRVAAHRLRQRYRELLCEEIGHTVESPLEIQSEIKALFAALSG